MRLPRFWKDRRLLAVTVVAIVIIAALSLGAWSAVGRDRVEEITFGEVMATTTSERTGTYDHVMVADTAPILASAATPLAVWYDKPAGDHGMVPLLVEGEAEEAGQQARLKDHLSLSSPLRVDGPDHTTASIQAALTAFSQAGGAVVVDADMDGYTASMHAALMASYLDIPVLVREGASSDRAIKAALREMRAEYAVLAGPMEPSKDEVAKELDVPVLKLDQEELEQAVDMLIADRFGRVDYGVLTNPSDVTGISCVDVQTDGPVEWEETGRFEAVERAGHMETFGTGSSMTTLDVEMAEGIQHLEVHASITSMDDPFQGIKTSLGIVPIVSLWLEDGSGQLVAYGSSIGYRVGQAALDVVAIDETDDLRLRVSVFYGISGRTNLGTMGNGLDGVGWSRIAADWEVSFTRTPMSTPMVPQVPGLSRMAPFLAAVHGGFVVADGGLSYLDEGWAESYSTSTGPWYDEGQHEDVNAHVEGNVEALDEAVRRLNLQQVSEGTLYETYTSGPAWMALLGDSVSIPQYYEPKDPSWEEDTQFGLGWATDEMYRLNGTLSIGRVLSTSVAGVSTLIARTMWYEEYTLAHMEGLDYVESNDWASNYMLLFGEGGGQTGGLFWQRPFADELRSIGWNVEQYGDTLENDRQTMELRGAYERSNFMEVMLHGNWYWYVPEMNGPDEYSTSVKNLDIRNWELGPSFFISAACLMGRIDGVPADQSIALNFMSAGVNAFVGATRSTGSESGTRWMEWSLLYNDTSVGEALRHSFAVNPAVPTVYVRTLFADPAFNPYEPGNGFSDQGRPEVEW